MLKSTFFYVKDYNDYTNHYFTIVDNKYSDVNLINEIFNKDVENRNFFGRKSYVILEEKYLIIFSSYWELGSKHTKIVVGPIKSDKDIHFLMKVINKLR